jgi:hypothetical protein
MRLRSLLLLATVAFALHSSAATFGELVEQYSNLTTGDASTVSGTTFTIGHYKLTMTDGKAAPVMAGKDVVGLFFRGNGTMQYDAVTAPELPLVAYNAKRVSHLDQKSEAAQTTLSGSVSEVLLLASGAALPQLGAGGAGSLSAEFSEHQGEFRRDRSMPMQHQMMLQKLSFPASKVVRAEMRSGRDEVVYVHDGAQSHDEMIYTLSHPDTDDSNIKQRLYPDLISQQPLDRDVRAYHQPPVVLTALDYTLVADGDNAKLTVTETLQRGSTQQTAIYLDQQQTLGVRAGAALRNFHVTSITDEKNRSLQFHQANDEMLVSVTGIDGESMKITFNIEGDFLVRPNNDNAWQLGTFAWFPQPPELAGQYYTVHSLVKVKKPFIAFAPGHTVHRGEEGDYSVTENVIDKPVQFAVVHAGKYDYTEDKRGPLTIRVCSYAGKNERAAKQLTNLAFSIIEYYQFFLGEFPFDEFNIIQVNTFGYGQAPPATMFITNEAFDSMLGLVNQFFSGGINERFAHEIAHQYWGHVVKMPSSEEQWLTETFAEYSAALALKKLYKQASYDKLVAGWKLHAKEVAAVGPIPFANRIGGNDAFRVRTYLLYAKGPYVLWALHQKELKDDNQMLTFMKSYQKSFRWKFGTTADVAGLLEFMTKRDFKPFFDKYYWGTAIPE